MKTIRVNSNATGGQLKQIEIVVLNYLKKYDDVSVVIKKFSETKTQRQLALYRGFWVREIDSFTGNENVEETHWNLKRELLHPVLMEKRESFPQLVELLLNSQGDIDESNKMFALYKRDMSLAKATKEEVMLYMAAVKSFMIHNLGFMDFTSPELRGLV